MPISSPFRHRHLQTIFLCYENSRQLSRKVDFMRLNKIGLGKQGRRLAIGMAAAALTIVGWAGAQRFLSGKPRLLSVQEIPEVGESCAYPARQTKAEESLFPAFEPTAYAQDANSIELNRPPLRDILDTSPIFSSVSVDTVRNEVYLQDSNRWSIRVFGRLDNAKPGDPPNEPRRIISGRTSDVQFNSCVWVDPGSGDIYTVENDTGDSIVVFNNKATGDAEPLRKLKVIHRAQSMAINDATGDLFLSVQYPPQVDVYDKTAKGNDKPTRVIDGDKTHLSDVHGLAIDGKNKRLFVNSWGAVSDY